MSMHYGNPTAKRVTQGSVFCPVGSWVQLSVGSTPFTGRQWVRLAPRGRNTIRLALKYVAKGADGTFTAPTTSAYDATIIPTTSLHIEAVGDAVAIYGRGVQNGGSSGGIKVIVTEYA